MIEMKSRLKSKPTRDAYVDIKAILFKINKLNSQLMLNIWGVEGNLLLLDFPCSSLIG